MTLKHRRLSLSTCLVLHALLAALGAILWWFSDTWDTWYTLASAGIVVSNLIMVDRCRSWIKELDEPRHIFPL